MNSLSLHTGTSLHAALSPRLQRAVRLLQMSSQDFARVLRDALDTNPFLEQEEALPAENWSMDGVGRMRQADGDAVALDTLQAGTSLAQHLLGQLHVLALPARDLALASAVVGCLDEDGYLRMPLAEVADALLLKPPPEPQELLIALRRVQALDPGGVGARSLRECLQLQLQAIPEGTARDLARAILADHLDALALRDMRALANCLGRSLAHVQAACAAIRRLDPHPGWRYAQPPVQYLTPDVIVHKVRGKWTAVLNETVVPRVHLNRRYVELFQQHRGREHAQLDEHLQEARWTVRNVQRRFSTILSVAQAILRHQPYFLAYGAMAMKPLGLREIAQEVGVHESTVSRVTNNKFMATPCGVFELTYFFSRGLSTVRGGECSPTAIRALIGEMIAAEPRSQPLSDVQIAHQLGAQGLQVARRTVTQYRQFLRIASADRRRTSGDDGDTGALKAWSAAGR